MSKDSRHFGKSLIPLSIQFPVMPGFELKAFEEIPKSDASNILSLSPVTAGS